MSEIEIVVSDQDGGEVLVPQVTENQVAARVNQGRVIQDIYVLNDAAALKKKMRNEMDRREPFDSGANAKDGSNVVVLMKTSFFEYLKSAFMQDLIEREEISEIGNAVATKAQTTSSGEAFVEFAMDITFETEKIKHVVKFIAYATTCKVMIQPIGEKASKSHDTLGKKTVSRYFVDTFLLPWCEAAYANKKYDEKAMLEAIKIEIVRLDTL